MILLEDVLAARNPECFPPRLPAGKQLAGVHKRLGLTGGFLPRFEGRLCSPAFQNKVFSQMQKTTEEDMMYTLQCGWAFWICNGGTPMKLPDWRAHSFVHQNVVGEDMRIRNLRLSREQYAEDLSFIVDLEADVAAQQSPARVERHSLIHLQMRWQAIRAGRPHLNRLVDTWHEMNPASLFAI